MKSTSGEPHHVQVARRRCRAGARRCCRGAACRLGAERDPVDHQHPAGRHRGRAHRAERSRWPPCPSGFSVQAPPRIAIDLPGVGNAMGRNSVEINQGNLRSVSVAQAGDRTRLVLNLQAGRRATAPSCRARCCWWCWTTPARRRWPRRGRRSRCTSPPAAEHRPAGAARHRLPPRHRRRRPRRRRPAQHPGRASTSASRARAWWSSSCAPRCPTTCAAAWT